MEVKDFHNFGNSKIAFITLIMVKIAKAIDFTKSAAIISVNVTAINPMIDFTNFIVTMFFYFIEP